MSWYDNEWGFSNRMADVAVAMGALALMRRTFRTLDDLAVSGKRVLVRADLNVPMKDGEVADTLRIERQAPTIRELADKGARVIVLSHFGRPKGKRVAVDVAASRSCPRSPLAVGPPGRLRRGLRRPGSGGGRRATERRRRAAAREHPLSCGRGSKRSANSRRQIAPLGDIFVNDAFSAAHRAHATTEALAHLLPSAAGRAMEAELAHLHHALGDPERPLMAVVGGAKISTKIALLGNLFAASMCW